MCFSDLPGLGSKVADDAFNAQFAVKDVEEYVVEKATVTSDNQILAVSGATISSRAVTNAVNAGLAYFRTIGGGN